MNRFFATCLRASLLLTALAVPVSARADTPAAEGPSPAAAAERAPVARWSNPSNAPLPVKVADPPEQPLVVQTRPDGRPFRLLPPTLVDGTLRVTLPPRSAVELWERPVFAMDVTPFGNAARWGAVPRIAVGPAVPVPGVENNERIPWADAAGQFRAYAGAELPVTVKVRNDDIGVWTHPRVELFAPDAWQVSPKVAEVISPARTQADVDAPSISAGDHGVLPPTVTGTASFTVRIPETARQDLPYPLVAFLRFDARGTTVTVQNSIDVTVAPPIARRYGMDEAGTKLVVHMENRFAPVVLGEAKVTVGPVAGSVWSVAAPEPAVVAGNVSVTAAVERPPPGDRSIRVPVVVTLGGIRMGQTPIVYAVSDYGAAGAREDGARLLTNAGSPVEMSASGACAAAPGGADRAFAFDVDPAFAVSDPTIFVSPTWITVTLENRGATRARMEYDAWGTALPSLAADVPITSPAGPVTLSFLLPDARFQGGLEGGADFRLVLTGDACVARVAVSKWNPLKDAPAGP